LLACSRCKAAKYCGAPCQRSDWARHKAECALLRPGVAAKSEAKKLNASSLLDELTHLFVEHGSSCADPRDNADSYVRKYHGEGGADPPETHLPRRPLVPGGPAIKPGWGAAVRWNRMFMSPLENAVSRCEPKAVESLVLRGEDVHARDSMTAWTPLHLAVSLSDFPGLGKKMLACARTLLAAGADPNALSHTRNTPLHTCLNKIDGVPQADVLAMVKLLVEAGADVLLPCVKGFTPLSQCDFLRVATRGYPEVAAFIAAKAAASR